MYREFRWYLQRVQIHQKFGHNSTPYVSRSLYNLLSSCTFALDDLLLLIAVEAVTWPHQCVHRGLQLHQHLKVMMVMVVEQSVGVKCRMLYLVVMKGV